MPLGETSIEFYESLTSGFLSSSEYRYNGSVWLLCRIIVVSILSQVRLVLQRFREGTGLLWYPRRRPQCLPKQIRQVAERVLSGPVQSVRF